jgi:FxsC-like protein
VPYYFFSYSREDAADSYLYRFHDDLARELAVRGRIHIGAAGFLDKNQPIGAEWSKSTGDALGNCKVFVPLYSPNYFASTYCGQEWHAFTARIAAHRQATGKSLASIVPVWWLPPIYELPAVVERIQDTRDQFGQEYREYGLRYLLQLKENESKYQDFLVRFATMLIAAGKNPPGPRIGFDLLREPNAFAVAAMPAKPFRERTGPVVANIRRITFVVVVGSRDQMGLVRTTLEVYGEGWDDWRPYHPVCTDPIALRAQGVAIAQRLVSQFHPADEDLFDLLQNAQERRELVVLILDPWTVEIDEYKSLLTVLNGRRYGTTAVVVPWDSTEAAQTQVRDALYLCLANWADAGESVFRDDIGSIEEFETILGQIIIEIRSRILKRAEVARRVREAGPTALPILTGPGS